MWTLYKVKFKLYYLQHLYDAFHQHVPVLYSTSVHDLKAVVFPPPPPPLLT